MRRLRRKVGTSRSRPPLMHRRITSIAGTNIARTGSAATGITRTGITIAAALLAGCLQWQMAMAQGMDRAKPPPEAPPPAGTNTAPEKSDPVLHVCADPSSLPQSNDRGEGYENKIAEALARDLGKKIEYTYFPQRMGFVRNTLRSRDQTTLKFKCDLIMGVPKGYELTATTQPYMRSTYAMVFRSRPDFKGLKAPEDL